MLRDAKPKLRKTILGDKGLLTCLCECSKNILKGNVPLSSAQKRKLRRHRRSLRELTLKKISKKKKKLIPLTKDEKKGNHELSSRRVCVENVLCVLKRFKVISERYRNRRKRFGLRFNFIAGIYNYEI